MSRLRCVAVAVLLVSAALTLGVRVAEASSPQPDAVANCRHHVESGRAPLGAPRSGDKVIGRLAFSGLESGSSFAGDPDYEFDGRSFFFLKRAPLLSSGRPVTVSVAPRFRDVVLIGVGGIPGYHRAVRYRPCAPGRRAFSYDGPIGRWTGWSGGFITTRRVCVKLQISDGERVLYRHVPLGAPCS